MPPWTSERMSWRSQLEDISAAPSSSGFVMDSSDMDSFEGLLFDVVFDDVEHVGEEIVRVIVEEEVVKALKWPDTSSYGAVDEVVVREVVVRVIDGASDLGGVLGAGREVRPRSSLSPAGTAWAPYTGDGRIGN